MVSTIIGWRVKYSKRPQVTLRETKTGLPYASNDWRLHKTFFDLQLTANSQGEINAKHDREG